MPDTIDMARFSPWMDTEVALAAPLEDAIEVDVVIVGAGYTGLSTALELRGEGLSVAVLEAQAAGFGASGRNAGHLTPTIGKDLPTLIRLYGRERVQALVAFSEAAIEHTEGLIERHAIECDYEPVGNVIAAVHPRQHRNIDRAARAADDFGIDGELLDDRAMESRGLPRAFTRGYFEPHGGVLDPGRYVRGLRHAALEAGAQLFEKSPVVGIADGPPAVVHTTAGRVRAQSVVLATNAYTPRLGRLQSAGTRLQVQLFSTEPISPELMSRIGWRGREGIYTAHEMLESYRLTADNRIVGGSKRVRAGFGGSVLADVDASVAALLERTFRVRFPELRDVGIARHWGGAILLSLDFLPVVGRSGRQGNVYHSIAYAGHGLAQASYAGRMIADLMLGRDGPGAALWSRRRLPTPPEPLRSMAFHALTGLLGAVDHLSDRRPVRREFPR